MVSTNSTRKSTPASRPASPFESDTAERATASDPGPTTGAAPGGPSGIPPPPPVGASTNSLPPDDDPFDPDRLRLSQDFAAAVGVRKLLTTVPVRKPSAEWWVRTHSDPAYQLETAVVELKEDREIYLVANQELWSELAKDPTFGPRLLVTSINRQGVLFLWPTKLPGPDGKVNEWHRSATEAADAARSAWTRVYSDMSLGAYRVEVSEKIRTEPNWPGLPMREILRVAFRDKVISTWDHPVLQRLRGEV
jgi:hypothetical protein